MLGTLGDVLIGTESAVVWSHFRRHRHAAIMTDPSDSGWRENAAGLAFNLKYGFGRMDVQ